MPEEDIGITKRDKIVLRELSANARVSLTWLAKAADCSVLTANKIVKKLAKKFDMKFTLEIDLDNLGFAERHIICIKFGIKPKSDFLQHFFKDDPFAQDVYVTNGGFDLMVFAAADTSRNYIKWETDLAANLSEYLPELRPSEFIFNILGYMPLNSSFVNFIKEGIKIDKKDRAILQLLNENSRISYRDMGKRLGISEDTIRYRVFKLVKKGIISRFTIAVQNASGVLSAYFMRYRFDKYTVRDIFPKQRAHNIAENEALPLINRTPIIVLMSGSYRFFAMSFGKNKEEAISTGVGWYSNLLRNSRPHESHAIVVKPIKGLLPLRNLDAASSYRYVWR